MRKMISTFFMLCCFCLSAHCADLACGKDQVKPKPRPIRDGFALFAVDGKIVRQENGSFAFTTDTELSDGRGVIKASYPTEILKSSALEQAVGLMKEDDEISLRVWGRLTTFKRTNYVFINYFLPMSQVKSEEKGDNAAEKEAAKEQDDVIPQDVLDKLRPKKFVDVKKLRETLLSDQDVVIVDRTGFITITKQGCSFEFDALGRNVEDMKFELLNCDILESVMDKAKRKASRIRFNIAGTATMYDGKYYLLLQRANETFSSGNFPR